MSLFVLTCPHCKYSKELSISVLPPPGTRTSCPRCKGSFTLANDNARAADGHSFLSSTPDSPPSTVPSPISPSPATEPSGKTHEPQPPLRQQTNSSPQRQKTLSFTFTGTAKEYFCIWIVNTLLRIVTLGLYSPWAKVRKRRFFYGNTLLNGSSFDYLADPLAILKGWLIAVVAFGSFSAVSQHPDPIAASVLLVLFIGLFPWVVVRSRVFNLRNSTHRNIRFGFTAGYREAYRVFLWWQLLIPLTLGILTPYVIYRQKRFLVENSYYGTTPFSFHATARDYFRLFIYVFILVPLATAAVWTLFYYGMRNTDHEFLLLVLLPLLVTSVYYVMGVYLPTALANLTWSSTGIGNHRFSLKLRVLDLLWIQFSSAVAVIASLGLLMPWASVRMTRYTLSRLTLTGAGDLDHITAAAMETTGATGEELGEVFGLDFGL